MRADDLRLCAASWVPETRLLGNVTAREIVAVCDELRAATATLERVRAALCEEGCGECAFVRRALADQPEAPECNYVGRCNSSRCPKHGQPEAPRGDVLSDGTWIRTPEEEREHGQPEATACADDICRCGAWLANRACPTLQPSLGHPGADEVFRDLQARRQPEAPKEQEAGESALVRQLRASFARQCDVTTDRVRDLAAANARIAELERRNANQAESLKAPRLEDVVALQAAKAQIAELEADNTRARNLVRQSQEDYDGQRSATDAANARADLSDANRVAAVTAAYAETKQWMAAVEEANARAEAAERNLRRQVALGDGWRTGHAKAENRCHVLSTERDQLAARADAAERDAADYRQRYLMSPKREDTERRRADAAEREVQREKDRRVEHVQQNKTLNECNQRLQSERDQLAARVTELEHDKLRIMVDLDKMAEDADWQEKRAVDAEARACTPEERAVLKATEGLAPAWADSAASSTDARIRKLGRALLANRATKAKRGGA